MWKWPVELNFTVCSAIQMSSLTTSEIGSGMLVRQAGRAPRLEMVSFKKLSKGTLALGIVFKVTLAISTNVYCVVQCMLAFVVTHLLSPVTHGNRANTGYLNGR